MFERWITIRRTAASRAKTHGEGFAFSRRHHNSTALRIGSSDVDISFGLLHNNSTFSLLYQTNSTTMAETKKAEAAPSTLTLVSDHYVVCIHTFMWMDACLSRRFVVVEQNKHTHKQRQEKLRPWHMRKLPADNLSEIDTFNKKNGKERGFMNVRRPWGLACAKSTVSFHDG